MEERSIIQSYLAHISVYDIIYSSPLSSENYTFTVQEQFKISIEFDLIQLNK